MRVSTSGKVLHDDYHRPNCEEYVALTAALEAWLASAGIIVTTKTLAAARRILVTNRQRPCTRSHGLSFVTLEIPQFLESICHQMNAGLVLHFIAEERAVLA